MPKLMGQFRGQLIVAQDLENRKDYQDFREALKYHAGTGEIYESERVAPGKYFIYFELSDVPDAHMKTSPGDLELDNSLLRAWTAHSEYVFKVEGEILAAGEAENDAADSGT